uniref:Regulator of G-protein signaling 7 n=3 Tax=Schistocephalus solidus TaxID=70667 RepID=A0A0V0J623_SCHSO
MVEVDLLDNQSSSLVLYSSSRLHRDMVSRCILMAQRHDSQRIYPPTSTRSLIQPTSPLLDSSPIETTPTSKTQQSCHLSSSVERRPSALSDSKKAERTSGSARTSAVHSSVRACDHMRQLELPETKDSPNAFLFHRLESLVEAMVSESGGIPIRNVKGLVSSIPSVVSGADIVLWLICHAGADDISEAVHLGSCISAMGYLFSIDDHMMVVKNDSHTYYRFQTPCLYPSRCPEADTVDYAVYLCKRTMQNKHRLELSAFEAERLASLQNLYYHKWEFIYMQAEAEVKVDKKRDKFERIVLESQEAAYWDVHRPAPGCVNTTEVDMRKLCRAKRPKKAPLRPTGFPIPTGPGGQLLLNVLEGLTPSEKLAKLRASMHKRVRVSKAIENLQNYCDQYAEFDIMLCTAVSAVSSSAGCAAQLSGGQIGSVPGTASPAGAMVSGSSSAMPLMLRKSSTAALAAHSTTMGLALTGVTHPSTPSSDKGTDNSDRQDSPSQSNPWISDNVDYWNMSTSMQDLSIKRVKRWSFSFMELLKDPIGRGKFQRWLEKEFAAENLMFWQQCQDLKSAPLRELPRRIQFIYSQYLSLSAAEPVNVDSKVREIIFHRLGLNETNELERGATVGAGAGHMDRYCFEEAEEQIFQLMKTDSYCRFLRSDVYRELFASTKKKSKKHRSGVTLVGSVVSFGAVTSGVGSSD